MNTKKGMPEVNDSYIEDLLKDKDMFDAARALRSDLLKRDITMNERWESFYRMQPSCKHIGGEKYASAMIEKYIKVYKLCLGLEKE